MVKTTPAGLFHTTVFTQGSKLQQLTHLLVADGTQRLAGRHREPREALRVRCMMGGLIDDFIRGRAQLSCFWFAALQARHTGSLQCAHDPRWIGHLRWFLLGRLQAGRPLHSEKGCREGYSYLQISVSIPNSVSAYPCINWRCQPNSELQFLFIQFLC